MAAMVLERTIAAPRERVIDALTQPAALARWWTSDLSASRGVGCLVEARFNQGAAVRQVEVAIQDGRNATRVVFTHEGFVQLDALYKQTRAEWDFYLDSLTSFLQTGKGTPYIPGEVDPL
jgi:hypothetical protein